MSESNLEKFMFDLKQLQLREYDLEATLGNATDFKNVEIIFN